MPDVELYVEVLNLRYTLRGFTAIAELKQWLEDHCSDSLDDHLDPATEGATPPVATSG